MVRCLRAFAVCIVLVAGCGQEKSTPTLEIVDDPSSSDGGAADAALHATCQRDEECRDGLFCNGEERCLPAAPEADARGCVAGVDPCAEGSSCDEQNVRCVLCSADDDLDDDTVPGVDCGGKDCADDDARRFPGNPEVCDDGHDEDCDLSTFGARDLDGDQHVDRDCSNAGGARGTDCNDANNAIRPGLNEACNGLDDDCDDMEDEALLREFFLDEDGDEHGDQADGGVPVDTAWACGNTPRLADNLRDCEPGIITVHELQVEFCDDVDNDCDGVVDDSPSAVLWYQDLDGDGFGDARLPSTFSCYSPGEGFTIIGRDCDDSDPDVSPLATELCDGKDNNCNGRADYRIKTGDYEDDDGDGHVDIACQGVGDDCDDLDFTTHAGAVELCDDRDNDCDGEYDEESDTRAVAWYVDTDGDGFGRAADAIQSCELVQGRVLRGGDCADADPALNPARADDCSGRAGVDDDCDGKTDENALPEAFFADHDGDGFGTGMPSVLCAAPAGHASYAGDCDEGDPQRSPGATETCDDGKDNDCDSLSDCDDRDCAEEARCAQVTELSVLGGAEQTTKIAQLFPEPLRVRLTDLAGAPLSGRQVSLVSLAGSGPAPGAEAQVTDSQGLVSFVVRAGRKVGDDVQRLLSPGARPLTVRFSVVEPAEGEVVTLLNSAKQPGDRASSPVHGALAAWARPEGTWGAAASADGTIYLGGEGRIFRLTVLGTLEHVAGDPSASFADGVDARASAMDPRGLVLDEHDPNDPRLYFADPAHQRIRVVALRTGVVSTVVGGGVAPGPDFGDGQAATSARLETPGRLALIGRTLYFTDEGIARLRKVDLELGVVETVALESTADLTLCPCTLGCSLGAGPAGDLFVAGRAVGKLVEDPQGICGDTAATAIVRMTASGKLEHVAGAKAPPTRGESSAITAGLPPDIGPITFDPAGNLYFAAGDHRVHRVDASTWQLGAALGDGASGNSGDYLSGVVRVKQPSTLLFVQRHLMIVEPGDATLRMAWTRGQERLTEVTPTLLSPPAASATILSAAAPVSVALKVADAPLAHATVHFRSANPAGYLSLKRTVTAPDGVASSTPWLGRALKAYDFEAQFIDIHGRPYHSPLTVQRTGVAPEAGMVLPLVNRTRGSEEEEVPGPGLRASVSGPSSVVIARDGTLYIASETLHRVYRLSPDGYLDVLAGTGVEGNEGDGGASQLAQLTAPRALALDEARGLLYVGQHEYEEGASPKSRIRVITLGAAPLIDTFVGGLNRIQGLALGSDGTLYVAKMHDGEGDGFRSIDPITREMQVVLPGTRYESGQMRFSQCYDCGVAVDAAGKLIVAASCGGDQFMYPRAPPYAHALGRFTVGGSLALEYLAGRNGLPLGCPADCTGGEGPADSVVFPSVRAPVVFGDDIYFVEREANRVRKLSGGQVTTLMGAGLDDADYIAARGASLAQPMALAVSQDGHVIVADFGHNEVRLIW